MVHIDPDYPSKKAFKAAVAGGANVIIYSPGPFPVNPNGIAFVEAPTNYHKWYAKVEVKDFKVVKVLA